MATPKRSHFVDVALAAGIAVTAFKAVTSIFHIITTTAPDFVQYYESQTSLLPPVSRFMYLFLRLLPFTVAQGAWVIASFCCLLWIVWKLGRLFGLTKRAIAITSVLAFLAFPTRFTLGMGQVNLIVLAWLVEAVVGSSGLWFAVCTLLKPELMFLMVPIVIRKKRRILASLMVVAVLMVVGWGSKFPELRWADAGVYYNQGLSGLVARAGLPFWFYGVLSGFILGVSIYTLRKKMSFSETVWRFLPTFILIEPIAWQHHFVFLVPTYVFLWRTLPRLLPKVFLMISYLLVSWNFSSPAANWLIASHGTLGVLILWIVSL